MLASVAGHGPIGVTRSKREFCTLTTHRAIKMPKNAPERAPHPLFEALRGPRLPCRVIAGGSFKPSGQAAPARNGQNSRFDLVTPSASACRVGGNVIYYGL